MKRIQKMRQGVCWNCSSSKQSKPNRDEHPTARICQPVSGLREDRKLTYAELVRAIWFRIAAEYEAIELYMQLAESTDNELAIDVQKDIAGEESVYAGNSCGL